MTKTLAASSKNNPSVCPSPSLLQIEFSFTFRCFGTMLTTRQVEPRQTSDKCSSSAASTRLSFKYVPFAESRSHSRTMSWVTPTTQCKAETWGSSISMSAPPPVRPMLVLALVSWYAWPFKKPLMTEIVTVLFPRGDGSMSEGNAPKRRRLWDQRTEVMGRKYRRYASNKRPIPLGEILAAAQLGFPLPLPLSPKLCPSRFCCLPNLRSRSRR